MAGERDHATQTPDFFVSHVGADAAWAEWIAWSLEAAGYTTWLQAWDSAPGARVAIDHAISKATRTIAVLSSAYLDSNLSSLVVEAKAWPARVAVSADRPQTQGTLLAVRVEDISRSGLWDQVVSIDLFGLSEEVARRRLLSAIGGELTAELKPAGAPPFPDRLQMNDGQKYLPRPGSSRYIPPEANWVSGDLRDTSGYAGRAAEPPKAIAAQKGRRRTLTGAFRAAHRALRLPPTPDINALQVGSDTRWKKIETRFDSRLLLAGPPPDEYRQPPSTNQPEDLR